jgi:PKD repeat protein
VDLYQPAQGIYQIFLLGTHSGNYKLTVRSYSQSGTPGTPLNFTGAITPGAVVPLQVILGPGGLTAQPFTNQCPWSATPTNGTSPLSVQFSSPGVDAQGNSITAWNWNFADGTSSTSQNPSHTYNSGGIFFPSLTVINSTGATVVGAGPAITIPLVRFTASPTNGVPPMMVQFTCPATDNLGNPLTQWTWGFGDGASSSQQNPSHIYTSIGAFAPTLSAVNNLGVTVTGQGPRISVLPYSGIVLNGGFETGDLTDWAQSGDTMFIGVDSDPSDVHSDSYGAYIGTSDIAPGYLSQPLRTTPGEPYLISLWLDSPDGEIPNEFSVAWQGTTVFDAVDLPAIGWTNIQLLVTANSPTTSLRFGYVNEISFFGLDEITVLPVRPVITGISLSGQDLVLKATNGLDGRAYRVLRSSSASLPLNQWTSIATNTIAGSGNFILTIPNAVDPSAAQRFFRIQLQ